MTAPSREACPLCGGARLQRQRVLATAQIIAAWQSGLGIDVRGDLADIPELVLLRCVNCSLEFFSPDAGQGSPDLYMQLEKFDWYYLPTKWEHDRAFADLMGARRALEIGCGFGDFVARAAAAGIRIEGCEQNPSAVRVGRDKGLVIHDATADGLAAEVGQAYDVVCSFQVLEHVATPGSFLDSCTRLLARGGRLLLGLPNSRSFLGKQFNVLDMPPHHMTRWNEDVLRQLPRFFPLRLDDIAYEPLPDLQVAAYVEVKAALLTRAFGLSVPPAWGKRAIALVRRAGLGRFLRGQTLYAAFTRV